MALKGRMPTEGTDQPPKILQPVNFVTWFTPFQNRLIDSCQNAKLQIHLQYVQTSAERHLSSWRINRFALLAIEL